MKYKIIGNKKINGKEPGDVIDIQDGMLAQSLEMGGHIQKVQGSPKKKDKSKCLIKKQKLKKAAAVVKAGAVDSG
jgi:hypothetical protein